MLDKLENETMNMKFAITLLVLLMPSMASAGFFGPDNYEECVLDKMKGQSKTMIHTARKACERKFPYEQELSYYRDKIEFSWYSDSHSLNLDIDENNGDYYITRYKASFSKKSCDEIKAQSDYTLSKTFKLNRGSSSALISLSNANEYRCMRTEKIWGEIK